MNATEDQNERYIITITHPKDSDYVVIEKFKIWALAEVRFCNICQEHHEYKVVLDDTTNHHITKIRNAR
jgi:hypothetical protein